MNHVSETGGARIGGIIPFNYSAPFAQLHYDAIAIRLKINIIIFKKEYLFPREAITNLTDYEGLFSRGIRIQHKVEGLPQFVVFWARNCEILKNRLSQFGYPFSHRGRRSSI